MKEKEYDEAHSAGYRCGWDNGMRKKEMELLPELERLRKEAAEWEVLCKEKLIPAHDKLKDRNEMLEELISELSESAEYWIEYDVPLGIVDRIKAAVSMPNARAEASR